MMRQDAFLTAVVFPFITLPVEFNASSRAKNLMLAEEMIYNEEKGVNKVLNAAALISVLQ
jgi:uncharacterized protein